MLKKLAKSGMFGLAGLAATNKDVTNKIARNGGLGIMGMMLAKKKRAEEAGRGMSGRPMMDEDMGGRGRGRGRPMMDEVMTAEQVPASRAAPIMAGDVDAMMGRSAQRDMSGMQKGVNVKKVAKGGKISAAQAVHKHERAKHKGQPLTKMAKGGSASRRGDGCATKGKTKGRFV